MYVGHPLFNRYGCGLLYGVAPSCDDLMFLHGQPCSVLITARLGALVEAYRTLQSIACSVLIHINMKGKQWSFVLPPSIYFMMFLQAQHNCCLLVSGVVCCWSCGARGSAVARYFPLLRRSCTPKYSNVLLLDTSIQHAGVAVVTVVGPIVGPVETAAV